MGENERAKIKRARDIPHITQLEAWKMEMLFSRRFYGFVLKINHKIRRCAFLQETTIPATHTHTHTNAPNKCLFLLFVGNISIGNECFIQLYKFAFIFRILLDFAIERKRNRAWNNSDGRFQFILTCPMSHASCLHLQWHWASISTCIMEGKCGVSCVRGTN